jgi:hypothetical protein
MAKKKRTVSPPPTKTAQVETDPRAADAASANRLGLYIALFGIVAVLAIGGALVWLNMQSGSQTTEPPLAPSWNVGLVNECRGTPKFPIEKLGFSRAVVFSTSERLNKGLELIEPGADGTLENAKRYQHPSWTMGGYLGTFVVDSQGNVYVAPSPRISLIDNPPDKANILYKVDTQSGVMTEYLKLPSALPPSSENPYGILALTYDCDTNSLYVTSVMGSTRGKQVGRIYQINLETGQVVDQYDDIDTFGVAAFNLPTGKRLYFGSARTPEVYSIALDSKGNFWGQPRSEVTLNGAFNKARRIDFNVRNQMQVRGIDFNFTLSATSEDRRTDYVFAYDDVNKKWIQISP